MASVVWMMTCPSFISRARSTQRTTRALPTPIPRASSATASQTVIRGVRLPGGGAARTVLGHVREIDHAAQDPVPGDRHQEPGAGLLRHPADVGQHVIVMRLFLRLSESRPEFE